MTFEDDLRAAMRTHDGEAPTGLRFTAPRSRRRMLLPFLAAAVVVAVSIALAVAVSGGGGGQRLVSGTATMSCPTTYRLDLPHGQSWVPAQSKVSGVADRLVPTTAPTDAKICSYAGGPLTYTGTGNNRLVTGVGLTGRRSVTAGLSEIPATLSLLPAYSVEPLCDGAVTPANYYLLALRYPSGVLWVSAPALGDCEGSSNGSFRSRVSITDLTASAFASGRWPGPAAQHFQEGKAACSGSVGRLGDTGPHLFPEGVSNVWICPPHRTGMKPRLLSPEESAPLLRQLLALKAHVGNGCEQPSGASTLGYDLALDYPTGPSVTLSIVPACTPDITSGGAGAHAPSSLIQLIAKLAAR
jgi:hypothetical protein